MKTVCRHLVALLVITSLVSAGSVGFQATGGYGTLHGGLGGTLAIGPHSDAMNGSQKWSILAGVGTLEETLLWKAGFRYGESAYGALGYGGIGVRDGEAVNGVSAIVGYNLHFSKFMVGAGIGYDYGKAEIFGEEYIIRTATIDIGLGLAF